jgi:hypothetical protein
VLMVLCELQARIGELANELAPHQLSTILWALGKMQAYPGIEIMETLVTRSRISLAEHDPQVPLLSCLIMLQSIPASFGGLRMR